MTAAELSALAHSVTSDSVAKAMLDTVNRVRREEAERFSRFDTRATTLLGAAGIATALLGVAAKGGKWSAAAFVLASICGLIAATFALGGLRVKPGMAGTGTEQDTIFDADYLRDPDETAGRRYLALQAVDTWMITQEVRNMADRKAWWTKRAQYALGGLLVFTMAATVLAAFGK